MKKAFPVIIALLLILQVGCAHQIRYSEEEIKTFPPDIQDHIRKGEVKLGMTSQMVRYAWGPPETVRILEPYEGKPREEWIYSTLGVYGTKILVFLDGKLIYYSR
ncbi:MAG: hypothetical protein FJ243_00430 [Nitrospira sp.]|nr:hypothetical protein [Nitrospira sp.]